MLRKGKESGKSASGITDNSQSPDSAFAFLYFCKHTHILSLLHIHTYILFVSHTHTHICMHVHTQTQFIRCHEGRSMVERQWILS